MVAPANNLFSAKCVIVGDGAVGKVKGQKARNEIVVKTLEL